MVRSPSPSTPATAGADSASAGWVSPLSSPGTSPWVAKARILNPDRSMVLTVCSLASLPRLSTFEGSACSASAIDFNSSAVSGSRGSMAKFGAVDALELRSWSGASAACRASSPSAASAT